MAICTPVHDVAGCLDLPRVPCRAALRCAGPAAAEAALAARAVDPSDATHKPGMGASIAALRALAKQGVLPGGCAGFLRVCVWGLWACRACMGALLGLKDCAPQQQPAWRPVGQGIVLCSSSSSSSSIHQAIIQDGSGGGGDGGG